MLDLINFQPVRWRCIKTFWISNIYRLFNRKFYSFIWSCSQFWAKMMWNCICLMKRKVICAGRSHDSTVCPASDDLQRAADSDSGSYKLHSHIKTPAERQDERRRRDSHRSQWSWSLTRAGWWLCTTQEHVDTSGWRLLTASIHSGD